MKTSIPQLLLMLLILTLTSCANQKYYSYLKKVNQNLDSERLVSENLSASAGPNDPIFTGTSHIKFPKGRTVKLNSGTPIPLELVNSVSTASPNSGTPINFRVQYDVKVGDDVVIRSGSMATGNIVNYQPPKEVGKPGSITVQVNSVQAVDGTMVPVSGNSLNNIGKDNTALVIILAVLFVWFFLLGLLFLLIKGGHATINAGTQVQGVVSTDTMINVE